MNAPEYTALADMQANKIDCADHALYRGVALAPNVATSDKGNDLQRRVPSSPNATRHPLSPAERTAKLLAYRPGFSHNFTAAPVSQVTVKHARGAFKTS